MGGAKKKSMAQMEKTQDQTDKKDEPGSKKGKAKTVVEKRPRGLQSPDISDPKFLAEVQKMGAITPFSIASQFNLRLSVAKDLLEDLEKRRLVGLSAAMRELESISLPLPRPFLSLSLYLPSPA